jgi:hypothetical protein
VPIAGAESAQHLVQLADLGRNALAGWRRQRRWALASYHRAPVGAVGVVVASFLALGGTAAAQSPDGWFLGCKAFAEGRANTQPQLYGMQSYCSGVVHGLVAVGPLLPANLITSVLRTSASSTMSASR